MLKVFASLGGGELYSSNTVSEEPNVYLVANNYFSDWSEAETYINGQNNPLENYYDADTVTIAFIPQNLDMNDLPNGLQTNGILTTTFSQGKLSDTLHFEDEVNYYAINADKWNNYQQMIYSSGNIYNENTLSVWNSQFTYHDGNIILVCPPESH